MIRILIALLFLTSCSVVEIRGYQCIPNNKIYVDTMWWSDGSIDVMYYYYEGR